MPHEISGALRDAAKYHDPAFGLMEQAADALDRANEMIVELREAAYDYARLIQVEHFPPQDMAVHRAYERLRKGLGNPIGLATKPHLVRDDR